MCAVCLENIKAFNNGPTALEKSSQLDSDILFLRCELEKRLKIVYFLENLLFAASFIYWPFFF